MVRNKRKHRDMSERLSCFQVWKNKFLLDSYKNYSERGIKRDYNFYSDGLASYSYKDNVTYYYTFDGYPKSLPISFVDDFREQAEGDTLINFINNSLHTNIDWNSPSLNSKLNTWRKAQTRTEDVDEFNYRENMNLLDLNTSRKRSLVYLSTAEIKRGRSLFKVRMMMIIAGKRGYDFDITVERCEELAKKFGLNINRVTSDMSDILKAYSPMSAEMNGNVTKLVGNIVLPDEIIARFSSLDQGKIGERGIYWGTDIYSGYPVLKVVKKTNQSAENILITAESGHGKSLLVKLLISGLSSTNKFTGTIMDVEGDEYQYLADFLSKSSKVVKVNMSQGNGRYFDPVAIYLTGDKAIDADMFDYSVKSTSSLLNVLVGESGNPDKNKWVNNIIYESITKTYVDGGVYVDNQSTWGRSKDLSLKDVYNNFKVLYSEAIQYKMDVEKGVRTLSADNNFRLNANYIDALDSAFSSLRTYFEPYENGGIKSTMFKHKLGIDELATADLVVCSFGLRGKAEDKIDEVELALSQSYAAIISHIRSIFSKSRGYFNYKVWEEFQRWGRIKGAESILNAALTGGRKNGDVNLILTNKVSELLSSTDTFGIFDNITSFVIGGIDDAQVREELCKRLSISDLKPTLDKLVVKHKAGSSKVQVVRSIYDNAFLVKLDKSVVTVLRVELPDDVLNSDIFSTGVKEVTEV